MLKYFFKCHWTTWLTSMPLWSFKAEMLQPFSHILCQINVHCKNESLIDIGDIMIKNKTKSIIFFDLSQGIVYHQVKYTIPCLSIVNFLVEFLCRKLIRLIPFWNSTHCTQPGQHSSPLNIYTFLVLAKISILPSDRATLKKIPYWFK